eukprot:g23107.t1
MLLCLLLEDDLTVSCPDVDGLSPGASVRAGVMAFDSSSAVYGVKAHVRCVEAVQASQQLEKHQFLVGTATMREPNELHLLEYDEDSNHLGCVARYLHPAEVEGLGTHLKHPDKVLSVRLESKEHKAALWSLKASKGQSQDSTPLKQLCEFAGHAEGRPVALSWNANDASQLGAEAKLASSLAVPAAHASASTSYPLPPPQQAPAGCWDPHHATNFAASSERALHVWDLRSGKAGIEVPAAHAGLIRDLDYNPNKIHHLVTGGEDCKIRIWDLRKPKKSLRLLSGHSHWVTSVKYNRFHDQLLLSGGAGGAVLLWSVLSVSSAPLGDLEDPTNRKEGDRLLQKFDEHEQSVYGVAWSWFMAWVFVSVSWDGQVIINHVPPAEKYKILL